MGNLDKTRGYRHTIPTEKATSYLVQDAMHTRLANRKTCPLFELSGSPLSCK